MEILPGLNSSPYPQVQVDMMKLYNNNSNTSMHILAPIQQMNQSQSEISGKGEINLKVEQYAYIKVRSEDVNKIEKLIFENAKKKNYNREYMRKRMGIKTGHKEIEEPIKYEILFTQK